MTAGSRVWVSADGALQVQAVRASDAGEYTCVVTSPGGNHTRNALLSVIELPFAPTNVRAVRVEATPQRAVNVSWTPGFDGNSPIQKFIVQKRIVPEFGMSIFICYLYFYATLSSGKLRINLFEKKNYFLLITSMSQRRFDNAIMS